MHSALAIMAFAGVHTNRQLNEPCDLTLKPFFLSLHKKFKEKKKELYWEP